jgi:hypothetical protein
MTSIPESIPVNEEEIQILHSMKKIPPLIPPFVQEVKRMCS